MTGFADISEMSPQLQLMIGTGSHLDPAELDPMIMVASLTVMQNAAGAGLDDDALSQCTRQTSMALSACRLPRVTDY